MHFDKKEILEHPVTSITIALCVVYYLYTTLRYSWDMTAMQGLSAGAYNPVYVSYYHQYARLLTANFVHFGLLHIAVNSYSLYNLGFFVETFLKRRDYIIILLVSALATNGLPYLVYISTGLGANSVSGGISGVIFGLMGTTIALYLHYPHAFKEVARSIGINIVLMILVSLMVPSISLSGHISGLIGGFIISYLLIRRYKRA